VIVGARFITKEKYNGNSMFLTNVESDSTVLAHCHHSEIVEASLSQGAFEARRSIDRALYPGCPASLGHCDPRGRAQFWDKTQTAYPTKVEEVVHG